jgi:hypothetical protein
MAKQERVNAEGFLRSIGWVESGGGDDFTEYVPAGSVNSPKAVYYYDDGRWEAFDFDKTSDDPENAVCTGKTLAALKWFLASW